MKEGYKHDSELTKKGRKKRKKNVIREKNIVSVINDKNNVQSVISNINSSSLKCRDTSDLNTQFPKEQIVSVPVSLNEKIVSWSIKFAISRAAVTSLLHILHDDNESLPLDSRTLLNTPRTLSITSMKPGKFLYIGLEKCLRNVIQQIQNAPDILYLDVFVDGAPIYKDSYENGQIWPILIRVINLNSAIFPICIFGGSSKPESFNEFLMPFMKEFTSIHDNFQVKNSLYKIKINNLILDTPARSSVLGIVGHTGYNSCPKCHAYGRRVENRTILLETDSPLRTDHEFRLKTDSTHHKNVSIIEQLPNFNMINSVPLDYLHTILLGVMRKMLDLWFDTKSLYPPSIKAKISQKISLLSTYEPKEFQRRLRGLEKMKLWKGNELRTFLLFIGPSALKDYISYEHFQHFLLLHIAITILVDESLCIKFNPIAKDLLYKFVEEFPIHYGEKNHSFNVHLLLHICDDVIRNGCLDNFSAFKFESYLGKIKSFVKSPHKPVEQIYNRMVELLSFSELGINESAFNYSLKKPLENDTYGKIFINGVLIDGNTTCDSFVQLMNGELVKILRFKMVENEVIAIDMDEFIVVVFTIDDSCAVIRKDWLVDEKSCFFPPTNEYNQAIKGKPKSSQRTWIVYDIVIQKKFATQRDADLYCKTMSDVGTSSDELQIQREREIKRKFPISTQKYNFNLNQKILKLENDKHKHEIIPETVNNESVHFSSLDNFSMDTQEQNMIEESSQIVNTSAVEIMISNTQYTSIVDLINSLHQKVDNLAREVKDLKQQLAHQRGENMQEQYCEMITSKEDLIQLSDRMKDAQIRKQMILNLKLVGAAPGFHNANYARIAAILTKLFENKFLKNCSWSKQPGKIDADKIYIIDYPIVTELISEAMSTNKDGTIVVPEIKVVREGIQNFFKRNKSKLSIDSNSQ